MYIIGIRCVLFVVKIYCTYYNQLLIIQKGNFHFYSYFLLYINSLEQYLKKYDQNVNPSSPNNCCQKLEWRWDIHPRATYWCYTQIGILTVIYTYQDELFF